MPTRQERNQFKKVMIKPEEHVVFQFSCTAFSQPGLGQHMQKDQPLEIVFNHITYMKNYLFKLLTSLPRK